MGYVFSGADCPPGRLVQGDAHKSTQVKDDDDKLVFYPDGKPKMQRYVGVAYSKTDPVAMAFIDKLRAAAKSDWPQYFDAAGNCTNPSFSSKIIDGDGKDKKGKPYASKDGFAGHFVVKYTTFFDPPALIWDTTLGAWKDASEGIVTGDYIRVEGDTKTNAGSKTDGMYMNFSKTCLWQKGERIVSGTTAEEAFGNAPPPAATGAPANPTPPAPAANLATPAASTAASSTASGGNAAPPPPHDMGVAGLAPPPPPPAGPVMLPAAKGATYEACIKAGWTDETLRAHGMMA